MKKVFVSFVLAMAVISLCAAQNTINEYAIIGTWTNMANNVIWTFSADGKLTTSGGTEATYGIYGTKLIIVHDRYSSIFNITMSFDARTLILEATSGAIMYADTFDRDYWLRKQ